MHDEAARWNHTASLMWMVYTVNRGKNSPKLTPDDFNPLVSGKRQQSIRDQLKEKLERIRQEREFAECEKKPVL